LTLIFLGRVLLNHQVAGRFERNSGGGDCQNEKDSKSDSIDRTLAIVALVSSQRDFSVAGSLSLATRDAPSRTTPATVVTGSGATARAIPVFRYEDTDGADLPTYTPRDPPPLLEVAEKSGMRVNYVRLSAGVYGYTDYERKVIGLATESWDVFFHELAHTLHRTFEPKTSHGQEPEAETIAQLVAATLARLYGKPDDGFSWTYIASQAQSSTPQQVGRLCLRVLDRAKKVLDLIYAERSPSTELAT
jgi:hypothetical protein